MNIVEELVRSFDELLDLSQLKDSKIIIGSYSDEVSYKEMGSPLPVGLHTLKLVTSREDHVSRFFICSSRLSKNYEIHESDYNRLKDKLSMMRTESIEKEDTKAVEKLRTDISQLKIIDKSDE